MSDILIRRTGEQWRKPSQSGYEAEAHLQNILLEHPELIPGVPAEAKICIEFQSGVGPSDVVAVDPINGLTLVECKLASNREVRREIVGQVMDYASRFWHMSIEEFDAQWRVRAGKSLFDVEEDYLELKSRLEKNLDSGEFRIILAVDEINDDLRRIVEYINHITLPSVAVIAVVYSRSEDQGLEILSRQIYGEELAASKASRSIVDRDAWSIQDLKSWVRENESESEGKVEVLLETLFRIGATIEGGRAQTPSLLVGMNVAGEGFRWPIVIYTQAKGTSLELRFQDFKSSPLTAEKYLQESERHLGQLINGQEVRNASYSKRPNPLLRDMSEATIQELIIGLSIAFQSNS